MLTEAGNRLPVLLRKASLQARLAVAAALLLFEKTVLNLFVDFGRAQEAQGVGAALRIGQHGGFRFLVSLAVAIVLFGWLGGGRELADADAAARGARLRSRWFALHVLLVVPLAPLSMALYSEAPRVPFPVVVGLWLLLAGLAVVALFTALAPWSLWRPGAEALGVLWGYSIAAAAGSVAVMGTTQSLWASMAWVTFEAVSWLLGWLIPAL